MFRSGCLVDMNSETPVEIIIVEILYFDQARAPEMPCRDFRCSLALGPPF